MEQQQGRNWTLEDIKGALMDDMNAMIQDELRQALAGLVLQPAPIATIPFTTANPPVVDAPNTNNGNAGGNL